MQNHRIKSKCVPQWDTQPFLGKYGGGAKLQKLVPEEGIEPPTKGL